MRTCSHNDEGQPEGYIERSEWAALRMRTHDQKLCGQCGLYALWVPREKPRTDEQLKRIFGYVPSGE